MELGTAVETELLPVAPKLKRPDTAGGADWEFDAILLLDIGAVPTILQKER